MSSSNLEKHFTFRTIKPEETEQAIAVEQTCFPPNEACSPEQMRARIEVASDIFLVAVDRESKKIAGSIIGLATDDTHLEDDFFTNALNHNPKGRNVMITSVAVLPEYRRQGLARALMARYQEKAREDGRSSLVLTCLPEKVGMYQKFGFTDLGISDSQWGGEQWHEMIWRVPK